IIGQFNRMYFKKSLAVPLAPYAIKAAQIQPLKPTDLPALQLNVEDLRVANFSLGRTEFISVPSAAGLQIKKFSTKSPLLTSSMTGLWQGEGINERIALKAQIKSPDLGKLVSSLQIGDVIKHGELKADIDIFWSGSPVDFNLQNISGVLDLDINEGQILNVDPGGGRVLGLFSLTEIPRRLSLDFSDFFGKGFAFKKITGRFNFGQGKISSDNLFVAAPAADLKISGSSDFVTRQYNQIINVYPKTSGILPVIGALTAGPIGIAAGVVAQAVFKKPISASTELSYSITGPWSKPEVKKIDSANRKDKK
ncbi:MAG TPA: AsmA-like C-terminal region-containing protein, partial [Arenimonas sp.]|nr:AsmA-like C-terminal region-containing protein [Arenimonas sp.]